MRTLVAWHKLPDDPPIPIPTTRALLLTRLRETSSRDEPLPPFHQQPMTMPTTSAPSSEGQQQGLEG